MTAKDFHKSPSQIIKNVYDPDGKKIKVDDSSDFKDNEIKDQSFYLKEIARDLKAIRFHFEIINEIKIDGDDI